MKTVRSVEQFGEMPLKAGDREKLKIILEHKDLLDRIFEWYERQLITKILVTDDHIQSTRLKGVWQGFSLAFDVFSRLAAEEKREMESTDSLFDFYVRASNG